MSLISFFKSLPHKIGKNEVAKSCEIVLDSLREFTIPSFKSAIEITDKKGFVSAPAKTFQNELRKEIKGTGTNMFEAILDGMLSAETILNQLRDRSETLFAEQEATLALNYQKATYLRFISAIGFAVDYSRRMLNYIYVHESHHAGIIEDLNDQLPKAEVKFVEEQFKNFCLVMRALSKNYAELEKEINDMPDAVVTELSEQTFPATLGVSKVDPLGFNNFIIPGDISARWNPFYLIGTMYASFQVAQFKTGEAELELLKLRKLNLEKAYNKNPDPALQTQIEGVSARVNNLHYEMEKLEKRYGINN